MLSELISDKNQEEAIKDFLDLLNRKTEECLPINGLLEVIGNYFCADCVYIFEQNNTENKLENTFLWEKSGINHKLKASQKISTDLANSWKENLRLKGTFYIKVGKICKKTDLELYELLKAQNITSMIITPLVLGGQVIGFLGIDNPSENQNFLLLVSVMAASLYKEILSVRENEKSRITENKLKAAIEAAEEANKAKSNFLFNMSHDIRTPMNAIIGYNTLIKKNADNPEKVLDYQSKIENSSEFLLGLINDVLDMARIESGKAALEEECVKLPDAMNIVISTFQAEAKKRKQIFTSEISIKHQYITCDRTKVRQILTNLLSNAIKYTPEGGKVSVKIYELECEQKDCAKIQTVIQDNGIGISEDFLPQVFDSFSRERNSTKSGIAGTGLGMAIVKRLIDLMGGTISIESQIGKGTKITFVLTHKIADNFYPLQKSNQISVADVDEFKGKRILLAEDNDMNAEITTAMLNNFGFIVERAKDGVDCVDMLNKAKENYYNLVLMDIQMPQMDGYKATNIIRNMQEEWIRKLPVIALTANAFEEDKRKAFAAGMNAHIAKPIKLQLLLDTIHKFL